MLAISAILRYTGPKPIKHHRELQIRPARPPFMSAGVIRKKPISHAAVERAVNDVTDKSRKDLTSCCCFPMRRMPAASVGVDFVDDRSWCISSSEELSPSLTSKSTSSPGVLFACEAAVGGDVISTASPWPADVA